MEIINFHINLHLMDCLHIEFTAGELTPEQAYIIYRI